MWKSDLSKPKCVAGERSPSCLQASPAKRPRPAAGSLPASRTALPSDSGTSKCCRRSCPGYGGGAPNAANLGILRGLKHCRPWGWPPADLSAFLFLERVRESGPLLEALLACPARKWTTVWETRTGGACPQAWDEVTKFLPAQGPGP